jgi:cellulose synthase/poly-beta-1,6-N-acetylglucosamine synthase-like glycosyltransferase
MMTLSISLVFGLYLILVIWFWLGWERISACTGELDGEVSVSIIIPVRNEAGNITNLLNDISAQSIGMTGLEIIVVDDNSDDNTNAMVSEYAVRTKVELSILRLSASKGKKAALQEGIEKASGAIIITVDGDCRVGKGWVAALLACFADDIQMVSGPVAISSASGFFTQLQMVEFASLIGSGAATMGWKKPTMCNGANLAFRKRAYENVGGYDDTQLASGDDVFLMHKMDQVFPGSVVFCKNDEALVTTAPAVSAWQFFQQRKRWAGKWSYYNNSFTKMLALMILVVQLTVILSIVLAAVGQVQWLVVFNLILSKAIFEYFFLQQIVSFHKKKINYVVFLSLQIIYPFYVVITVLGGLFGNYEWKNRSVR